MAAATFPGDIPTAIADLEDWKPLVQRWAPTLSNRWGYLYKYALQLQHGQSGPLSTPQLLQAVMDFGNSLIGKVPWYAQIGYEMGNDVSHTATAAGSGVATAARAALPDDLLGELETAALWIGGGIVALMALPYILEGVSGIFHSHRGR